MNPPTRRENRVAELMAEGYHSGEIQIHAGLTKGQVSRTIQNIKRRLGPQAQ